MFSVKEILSLDLVKLENKTNSGNLNINEGTSGIHYDSRLIGKNEIFAALEGERDGHNYIESAIAGGASVALVKAETYNKLDDSCRKDIEKNVWVLSCDDVERKMGEIARHWRRRFSNLPLFCVTGSNGKTTTKDMMASVLAQLVSSGKNIVYPQGSLNNSIGVPRTLSLIDQDTEAVVLEVGTNHFGELKYLAAIAEPEAAVITNIGESHLEFLKDKKGVLRAKLELFEGLVGENRRVFINKDDEYLKNIDASKYAEKIVTYSLSGNEADYCLEKIDRMDSSGSDFQIHSNRSQSVFNAQIRLVGKHNIQNAILTFAVLIEYFKKDPNDVIEALKEVKLSKHRSEIIDLGIGSKLLNDCYNANPTSMLMAIKTIATISEKGFVAALGEMKEVGIEAEQKHKLIGQELVAHGCVAVCGVGNSGQWIIDGAIANGMDKSQTKVSNTPEDLVKFCANKISPGVNILVKASRGVKMETFVDKICDLYK